MKKIILFGSIPIAGKCLELLVLDKKVNVLGVITKKDYECGWNKKDPTVYRVAKNYNIPILSINKVLSLNPDLGISIRFHNILSQDLINVFKEGVINIHGGPLPYYRGVNSVTHAIINGEDEFGITMHYIDSGIDTGDIIETMWWEIGKDCTSKDLFFQVLEKTYDLFKKMLPKIINNEIESNPQIELIEKNKQKCRTYSNKDLNRYRKVTISELKSYPNQVINRIRAFDFPPHEPAYIYLKGKKIYLRVNFNGE